MRGNLRQRLASGPALVGAFVVIPAPESVELLAAAGYDLVVLDCEHGPFTESSVGPMVLAARAAGVHCLVRLRTADPSLVGPALDAGADGVLVPQVSSVDTAVAVTRAARYSPDGERGANPYVRAAGYEGGPDWYSRANEETAVLVMVEGPAGIAALPDILAVPTLDGVMVGPFDLSHAVGLPGQVEHPRVQDMARQVISTTTAAGRAAAVFAPTPAAARRWLDAGARLVLLGVDSALALAGFRAVLDELSSTR